MIICLINDRNKSNINTLKSKKKICIQNIIKHTLLNIRCNNIKAGDFDFIFSNFITKRIHFVVVMSEPHLSQTFERLSFRRTKI